MGQGLDELPTVGSTPAIANSNAVVLGIRIRQLPLTPERIWMNMNGGQ
jgi:CO/xanthine dehydrogenase Mo-binding subunit